MKILLKYYRTTSVNLTDKYYFSVHRREISLLTKKRDFLEENVCLLQERQLTDAVQQFAELEITKALKQDACEKLEQRKAHFEKLKNLRFLAREHGHVRADLLSILMQMQFRRLKDVTEFVTDARHYLTSEYLLSSARYVSNERRKDTIYQSWFMTNFFFT